MSRYWFAGVLAVVFTVLVSGIAAPPALAYPGYILTTNNNGGTPVSTQGLISYRATTQAFYIRTSGSPTYISCGASTDSSFGGSMNRGVYSTSALATVTSSHFGTATSSSGPVVPGSAPCQGPSGVATSITRYGTWRLGVDLASDPTSATPVADQLTLLLLTNIKLRVNVGGCSFDMGGRDTRTSPVPALYRTSSGASGSQLAGADGGYLVNSSGTSTFATGGPASAPLLRVWNTSDPNGCSGGTIKNGTQVGMSGSFSVSAAAPATNAIWLSS